jgi:hypothetical protein
VQEAELPAAPRATLIGLPPLEQAPALPASGAHSLQALMARIPASETSTPALVAANRMSAGPGMHTRRGMGAIIAATLLLAALCGALLWGHQAARSTWASPGAAMRAARQRAPMTRRAEIPIASAEAPSANRAAAERRRAFARAEAVASLTLASRSLSTCPGRSAMSRIGKARVTFAPDGAVSNVTLGADFARAPEATCITERLSQAHIAPFAGSRAQLDFAFFLPAATRRSSQAVLGF